METYFIQYLNQSFVLKASLWLYIILTQRKLKGVYYFIIQFNKKAKECKGPGIRIHFFEIFLKFN